MRQHYRPLICTAVLLGTVCAGACNRQESAAPELQTTTGVQPVMEPTTVTGCLKVGAADDTFVLTASMVDGSADTATYHLTAPTGMNLRNYVGQQVSLSGVVRTEETVTSQSGPDTQEQAKGTSGTPTVDTKTELDVKRLVVDRVQATGQRCE